MVTRSPLLHEPAAQRDRWQQVSALAVFAAALSLYALTLAPTVITLFDDSLEFQLVAYQLGIAHPTGYPLYTLLGWLSTRIPVANVAYRMNLMSAIFGALTVALVYLIGLELTQGMEQGDNNTRRRWARIAAAMIGALALAVSPVFWSQATVAEVYTLNAAFVAGVLWLLVRGKRQDQGKTQPSTMRWLTALAFLFGLSLTHHRTMVLLLPTIAFYFWRLWHQSGDWKLELRAHFPITLLRPGAKLAAALGLPLLLYLYIPLRGHVGSLDNTYRNTLAGFLQHVTAGGYGVFIFDNPFGTDRGVDFYASLFLEQFGWVGIVAGLAGFWALRRRDNQVLTGIAFITYAAFNLFYRVADIQVFFIPSFIIWSVWVAACAGWLLTGLGSTNVIRLSSLRLPLSLLIVLVFVGQSAMMLRNNLPALDRSADWTVHDQGLDITRQPLEPGAAIVGIQGEVTLIRYFQATEGLRPDLLPVAADQEANRLVTVARLLDEGRTVYLTRELAGAPARWSLSAVGPLIRVNPEPVLEPPDMPFLAGSSIIPETALYGYAVSRPPAHDSPPPLRLTLVWQVAVPLTRELKVSARLLSADGQPVAQADAVPVHFAYPTTAWRRGEFIADVYDLPLPITLEPGEYTPLIILYDPAQGAAEVGRLALPALYLP